jgi:heat shock protein HtpX
MQRMRGSEVKAVLGHEIGHVVNGDMVTMTLVQGIVNAFVMFLSRVLAYVIASAMAGKRRDGEDAPVSFGMYYLVEMLLQFALMIPGAMVVCWFSRWREFGADKKGAELAGRQNMIQALQALQATVESVDERHAPALQTLKISGRGTGLMRLFSTHPPLEVRIERLQNVR